MPTIYSPLRPGATIAVIAPASPASAEALERAPAVVEAMGYVPRFYPGCFARHNYLAGDDDCRLADLHAAFADDTVAAVLCLRGGYGSGRLLPRLDRRLLFARPKPLIGYSDITALHAQFSNAGIPCFHGPMLATDLLELADPMAQSGFSCLRDGLTTGTVLQPRLGEPLLQIPGIARGRLIGGNLTLVASLIGTPWALDTRDGILFLEDISELPYRVDRLLLQLQLSGALAKLRGVVLGHFTGDDSPQDVLRDYFTPLGIPVLSGWPAGHAAPNTLLPLGVRVELDAENGSLSLLQDVIAA